MDCIQCGKPVFEDRLCKDCFFQKHDFIKSIRDFPIFHCRKCGKIGLAENKVFSQKQFGEMFSKRLTDSIEFERNATIKDIQTEYKEEDLGDILCKKVPVKMMISGIIVERQKKDITREYDLEIKKHAFVCKDCSKQSSRYFEGILQLRDIDDEIVDFVRKDIEKNASKGIAIVDEANAKNGLDLYLTDKKYIRKMAETLYDNYGGEFKLNAQHFSMDHQTSKKIFRLNALFRPSPLRKGNIVSNEGTLYVIASISKTKLNVKSLMDESERSLNLDRQEVEVIRDIQETSVVKSMPHLEVLHPETYDAVAVANPKYRKMKPGERCKVALVQKGESREIWVV